MFTNIFSWSLVRRFRCIVRKRSLCSSICNRSKWYPLVLARLVGRTRKGPCINWNPHTETVRGGRRKPFGYPLVWVSGFSQPDNKWSVRLPIYWFARRWSEILPSPLLYLVLVEKGLKRSIHRVEMLNIQTQSCHPPVGWWFHQLFFPAIGIVRKDLL